jgi:hypothetical protein
MADRLLPNQVLAPNQSITSLNGRYYLIYQTDGNLVLYKRYPNGSQKALWASGTNGKGGNRCIMQGDGNLVIYNPANKALWSSNTFHDAGARLVMQDDGNAVIYRTNNSAAWATNTWMQTVNLHVKVLTNPSRFSLAQMVNTMRDIYIDAGINVVLRSTETLNVASPTLAALNDVDTGTCTLGNPSAEQQALSNFRANAGANDVVVYACRSVSFDTGSLNGCASFPAGRPMAVIASYCSLYTMAHEVGHVLGLNHVNDNNRLMTGNGTDNITNAPPDLVGAEIQTMLNSPFTV